MRRATHHYYIVPEYRRDNRRRDGWSSRVRYTIRMVTFPSYHKGGVMKDIEDDLSLPHAKRRLKSWRAYDRRKRNA